MGKEKAGIGSKNQLGYLDLNTKSWHHIILTICGYLAMTLILLLIVNIALVVYIANGMDLSYFINGVNSGTYDPEAALLYQKLSTIGQVISQIIVVGIVAVLFRKYFGSFIRQIKQKKTWIWFSVCLVAMYILDFSLSQILDALDIKSSSTNQDVVVSIVSDSTILGFLLIVIAGPLFEEVIFRLGVYRIFTNKGKKMEVVGLIITTLLFALIHMEVTFATVFSDMSNPNWAALWGDMLVLPLYISAGFGVTFSYYKSKNFMTPVLLHVTWNLIQFIIIYAYI